MKKLFENYQKFINEQQDYFYTYLASSFSHKWDDDIWYVGLHGTGWLQGSGKSTLPFSLIHKTTKGFESNFTIDSKEYKDFMKAVLVFNYRKKQSVSTTVAVASVLILKRWYYSLFTLTGQKHPVYLKTDIIEDAMSRYTNSSKTGDPNIVSTFCRCAELQNPVNYYAFSVSPLDFKNDLKFTNALNYTKKANKANRLKKEKRLDDIKVDDKDKLISISTFLNIVSLIDKCETVGEKILLNLVLLLIVTGFRSIEAITLRKDSLVRREIEDLVTQEKLKKKGVPLYFLGIKYVGAKGAGERIHWVEPLAIPLVESIFSIVTELTEPFRKHLKYLRSKEFSDYLPQPVYDLPTDTVEISDIHKFIVGTTINYDGKNGGREKTYKVLQNAGIHPIKKGMPTFYKKNELSQYIAKNFRNNKGQTKEPCVVVWTVKSKQHKVFYEDLLFIHAYRSTNLAREIMNIANPVPFDIIDINGFLGSLEAKSAFEKYGLKEPNGKFSRLTSHIPRHNINTFLAIANISDHLQAMLMGRVDISQNDHYKHIAIEHRQKAISILPYTSEIIIHEESSDTIDSEFYNQTPLEKVKETGIMQFSKSLDLEKNLKSNLHTFDGRDDVAEFMKASFIDGVFDDIRESFEELKGLEGDDAASELVNRHADLYPLKFGSCTYNIALWGCSYKLKCQSGEPCNYFTLTGRVDEADKLLFIKKNLERNLYKLKKVAIEGSNHQHHINKINMMLDNINTLEVKAKEISQSRDTIDIYQPLSDSNNSRDITTLADLFALEYTHQQGENDETG